MTEVVEQTPLFVGNSIVANDILTITQAVVNETTAWQISKRRNPEWWRDTRRQP